MPAALKPSITAARQASPACMPCCKLTNTHRLIVRLSTTLILVDVSLSVPEKPDKFIFYMYFNG
jgi:hypothetical protein